MDSFKKRGRPKEWEKIDLYKADVFSLGITLYQVACCLKYQDIKNINNSEREMEKVKRNINKLKYPLEIKQIILSMMEFKP